MRSIHPYECHGREISVGTPARRRGKGSTLSLCIAVTVAVFVCSVSQPEQNAAGGKGVQPRTPFASRSVRRALLASQVNPGVTLSLR